MKQKDNSVLKQLIKEEQSYLESREEFSKKLEAELNEEIASLNKKISKVKADLADLKDKVESDAKQREEAVRTQLTQEIEVAKEIFDKQIEEIDILQTLKKHIDEEVGLTK